MSQPIEFFINEEKGVVVAKVSGLQQDLANVFFKVGLSPRGIQGGADILNNAHDTLIAKARLNPEDIWNEDVGCDIARAKLIEKIFIQKVRVMDKLQDILLGMVGDLDERIERTAGSLSKVESKLGREVE